MKVEVDRQNDKWASGRLKATVQFASPSCHHGSEDIVVFLGIVHVYPLIWSAFMLQYVFGVLVDQNVVQSL